MNWLWAALIALSLVALLLLLDSALHPRKSKPKGHEVLSWTRATSDGDQRHGWECTCGQWGLTRTPMTVTVCPDDPRWGGSSG